MKRRGVPIGFEEGLAVACLALLVAITLLNVVTRYLTAQSFALSLIHISEPTRPY